MTDPTPTGYSTDEEAQTPSAEGEATLTTDDEAQRDDTPVDPDTEAS